MVLISTLVILRVGGVMQRLQDIVDHLLLQFLWELKSTLTLVRSNKCNSNFALADCKHVFLGHDVSQFYISSMSREDGLLS